MTACMLFCGCAVDSAGRRTDYPVSKNKNMKERYRKPSDQELRNRLTAEQYAVTQQGATERPYMNEYDREFGREYMLT